MDHVHAAWLSDDGRTGASGAADGLFPWWSFTKTALAVAALRLVDEGRLRLDEPRAGRPYTLRQLLTHRAGVPDYGRLEAYHEAVARGEAAWSRERLLEAAGAERLAFEPGGGWAYSNIGYLFVGDAIEQASGLPLGSALRKLVLDPLGLDRTRLAEGPGGFAGVHWPSQRSYDPRWVYHGCLIGPPPDAARLLHGLFHGELLAPAAVAAMHERFTRLGDAPAGRPATEVGYGMGLMLGRGGEAGRVFGHSGAGPGSVNTVGFYPDLAPAITVAVFRAGDDEGAAERTSLSIALDGGA